MPPKKKASGAKKRPTNRQLEALGKKWSAALKAQEKGSTAYLELAQQLYEIAIATEDAELRIVDHDMEKPKSKPKITRYKLTDPRAALLQMVRFCNIWVPAGQWVCLLRGCPPWNPPGAPPGKYCFLIGCTINVCPTPGAAKTRCIYLCI